MRIIGCFLLFYSQILFGKDTILNQNWKFKNTTETEWHPAFVPGTIHTDLLANQLIEDPFWRDHEKKLQWISQQNWEYQCTFHLNKEDLNSKNIQLQFEGIDTYADVFLNNKKILSANNMFRSYTIPIHSLTRNENELKIIFYSTEFIADSLAKKSQNIYPCENNRNWVRKAQYHFGWDWAPRFITCGIWRQVHLLINETQIETTPHYSPVKFIQKKDSIGQSFYFSVDGKPTFMKGANWVPADVFLPRISKDKYRQLLTAAKEAGFNMLRVWGGGIYEDDYFYELCDSLNIYVWQDFMFAGAMYPADFWFIENIKQEAIDNILRLRKFKCIVLWCGNNEIDEAWKNWGWQKQYQITTQDSIKLWKEYQKIFQELLPSLVKKYDSKRAYISSSPLYGWGRSQSMTHGDSHYWGVWWGKEPIQTMQKKIPRFMSEYGMQAMPNLNSLKHFLLPSDYDTSNLILRTHQKHPTGFETINFYLKNENILFGDFASYIHATQLLQSNMIEISLHAQLNSNGRCMGSLWWQFNDCWPVCSWSIVDFYGNKKLGYETMKKLLNP